jgi:putative tricarboxylic transport membrane protein
MPNFIRNPNNFLSGLLFIGIGLAFVYFARDYRMGSARQMGPAYFPTVLGGLLAALGAVLALSSLGGLQGRLEKFAWRPLVIVAVSLVAFGFLVRGAGLVPGVVVLAVISLAASVRFRLSTALMLGLGLAVFSWAVFSWGLGLPLPAFGTWFRS